MEKLSDKKIVDSWHKNAEPWVVAIDEKQIESRTLVTNQAIVDTVMREAGNTLVDIGCGEGWLVRELAAKGYRVLGIDAVAKLINQAQQLGDERYMTMSYEEIAQRGLQEKFDLAVCNFSLLGNESVDGLFKVIPKLLTINGRLIVQTIHPVIGCGADKYEDGWRQGSWQGFSGDFVDPAPWYFRTLQTWMETFSRNGLRVLTIREPLHPRTGKPASILFTAEKA